MKNKPVKNLLLTFDYELYLGDRSGTVGNCLIIPTGMILDILKKYNAKAIFFIDTTYIRRLIEVSAESEKAKKDLVQIEEQLARICHEGHYLFHHIHPHWLDAEYLTEENQWTLSNSSRFTVNLIAEKEREDLFLFSKEYLSKISTTNECLSGPDGFRAGGLFIEPFEAFKEWFTKNGIKYEFSVVPGIKKIDKLIYFDFTLCPDEPVYRFENNAAVKYAGGSFIEYTISRFELKGMLKIINGLYYRINDLKNKHFGDGVSVSDQINSSERSASLSRYFVSENIISVEMMNPIITYIYKKVIKKNIYLHFLSHPKLISGKNLNELDLFLMYVTEKYDVEFDFKKFKF